MSEEEKKAIELLKQPPDFSLRYYERENAIDIVLNLIEKKQKEIERLKEKQEYARLEKEQLLEDCVNKDKIRAKIREFEQIRSIIANEENQNLNYDMKRNDYCVAMLKELLGE